MYCALCRFWTVSARGAEPDPERSGALRAGMQLHFMLRGTKDISAKPKLASLLVAGLAWALATPVLAGAPPEPAKPAQKTQVRASMKAAGSPQQRIPRRSEAAAVGVQGVVRDERGIGVPEVEVKLTATTGQRRSLQAWTDGEGIFRLAEVLPGTYSIQLLKPGYETLDRSGLAVKAGEFPVWEFTVKSLTPMQSSSMACGPSAGLPTGKCLNNAPPEPQQPSYRELRRRTAEEAAAEAAAPPLPDESDIYIPMPDRWEIPNPDYRRYPQAHQGGLWSAIRGKNPDMTYLKSNWYDPFNVNRLKGDKPIIGNTVFFAFTGLAETLSNFVRLPLPSNVSTSGPNRIDFFGKGEVYAFFQNFRLSFELFQGSTQAFRPVSWRVKVTPAFNINYLNTQENSLVNIDPRRGTNRYDTKSLSLQEAFVEFKVKDLSPNYDVLFARFGIQQFTSDFRGFLYVDEQPGVRIFGNLHSNKWEYNLAYFYHLRKDANAAIFGLNRFVSREQQVFIANFYIQDFLNYYGYTTQFSFHYNKEEGVLDFDKNNFLARPSPIGAVHSKGVLQPKDVRALYLGWTGSGHFGRLNVVHAFYQAAGRESINEIAGRSTTINAQMAALELSIDKDWVRLRSSFFFSSGDGRPRNGRARGFDSIVDNPVFIGGPFSFWNREGIRLLGSGVALTSANSLYPALRASNVKELSHSNFVNPGIFIFNLGTDIELTPKLRSIINVNYLRFHRTEPIEVLIFQAPIRHGIGIDSSIGFQYRPPLSDNIVILFGLSSLQPHQGFQDIYTNKTLWSLFTKVNFLF
jgi:hypothetical protein